MTTIDGGADQDISASDEDGGRLATLVGAVARNGIGPVSYTHLTLPTSDLV